MRIKTKNDISFLKFEQLQEEIKENKDDNLFVAQKVMSIFYPKETNILLAEEFSIALLAPCKPAKRFRLLLPNLKSKASDFIGVDTYAERGEWLELFKLVLKPMYYWSQPIDFEKISLADAEYIISSFLRGSQKLKTPTNGSTTHRT